MEMKNTVKFSAVIIPSILVSLVLFGFVSFSDADGDNVGDAEDNCPEIPNPAQLDYDDDSLGNVCDQDDDNDKIVDAIDAFDKNPKEWADFDFDGIGSVKDKDDDNDGIIDSKDNDPKLVSADLTEQYLSDIQNCATMDYDNPRLLCYSQLFGKVTENEENNENALKLSVALSKLGAIDDCHFVSHQVGHVAYDENPNVIENLIGKDGTMCRGGYFHGVLASYFHDIGESGEPFPSTYRTVCDELIGSSNYQDCVHGIGHGLVHYFGNDLTSSLDACHDMSFYQNRLCMKGVMMQHTDNELTRQGVEKDVISNLCDPSMLDTPDFVECNMSIGTTLAFFSNHDFDEGAKSCELIEDKNGRDLCLEGLRLEIQDSEQYIINPLTQDKREKFQPQYIQGSSKIIDIRSPAIISDFDFDPRIGIISFSIDRPQYVTMYIPNEFVVPKMAVVVDGKVPGGLETQSNVLREDVVMIKFVPSTSGSVLITPLR